MSIKAYQIAKKWSSAPEKTVLYVTADEKLAESFKSDLEFFVSGRAKAEVCLFPAPDTIPYTHLITQPDIWIDRIRVLHKLYSGETLAIAAPIQSLLRKCPPKWIFQKYRRTIHLHETLDLNELAKFLTECGYINQPLVEDEGAFSIRGGIIDLFTPTMARPVRLELDGDEIISIRTFDPSTQRSSFGVSSFVIIPSRNVILNDDTKLRALGLLKDLCDKNDIKPTERREFAEGIEHGFYAQAVETLMPLFYENSPSLLDYLPQDALIFCDDEIEIKAEAEKLIERLERSRESAKHIEKIVPVSLLYDRGFSGQIPPPRWGRIEEGVAFKSIFTPIPTFPHQGGRSSTTVPSREGKVHTLIKQIQDWQEKGLCVITTCRTTTQAERMLDILRWNGLLAEISDKSFAELIIPPHPPLLKGGRGGLRSVVWIMLGQLSSGFVSEEDRLAFLTDEDIFGSKISKRSAAPVTLETFTDFSQLSEGDYVIHKNHGIGRYLNLKNLEIGGTKNDFLEIEYLGGDKLFLPVLRINLMSRYIGAGGEHVALDRLGGTRWTRAQKKVTAAIRTMAMELLKIYAMRETSSSFTFGPRDELLEEFEAAFPYDETLDQWRAIEETLAGMQNEKPSDRLICGDVGYGKTEVAMRAAFKAVADKKQAAILVPTTVLAFQHYENFMSRFADWPVRIEMLSRFRSRTEQKHIITELGRGMVEIVIGTHRLLGRDVKFHDLGLLIIDEEHRFGVAHKERIRKLKTAVDTITMSATPIPRTLYMSLSGIRDISIINTPPVNRLAIRTYVAEFDEDLIRGAIMAEAARGGQVFFVHNRVETIDKMHEFLTKLVPTAKIVVGHGQMNEHKLEDVMIKFLEKQANILLCTTIIESGIDIPSANTIIINRADTMGLAQLYQLRGRVGRSNVQAYAYLLTPKNPPSSPFSKRVLGGITNTAQKRLALLQRYTELGSGFQIAMHDLEIRGAGNILGAQQSGHINAIGYEMYTELLERAIRQLQGRPEILKLDVEITLPVAAYIPTDYIEDQGQRLVLYRRLAAVNSVEGLDEISKEIEDRFGQPPDLVKNLLKIVEIRIMAKPLMIESIYYDGRTFVYKFHSKTPVKPETILNLVKSNPKKFVFRTPASLLIRESLKDAKSTLSEIKNFLRAEIVNRN